MKKDKKLHRLLYIFIIILAIIIPVFLFGKEHPQRIKGFFSEMMLSKEEHLRRYFKYYGAQEKYFKWISFIEGTTPEGSLIILPLNMNKRFHEIRNTDLCNYFLFPRLVTHEKDPEITSYNGPIYRVNMEGFEYKGKCLKQYALNKNFSLLLLKEREKEPTLHLTDFTRIKSTFLNTFLALLKLTLIFTSGIYLVSKYFEERTRLSFFTTSFLVGTVISAIFYIFLSLIGINFTEIYQFLFLSMLSIPGIILLTKHRNSIKCFKESYSYSRLAFILVGLFFGLIFLKSIFTPIRVWDGCAIWGIKAKAVFAFHNLGGLKFWGAAPNYPPLLPILMSQVAIGGERLVKVIFPLFALCLYANIYDETLETKFTSMLKILLPIFIFTSTVFFAHLILAYANLALTVFVTKSFTILSKLLKDNAKKGWLSLSIMLCGTFLVRPDGQAYFFYIALLTFIWIFFKKYNFKNLLYFLIPLASIFLWELYFLTLNVSGYYPISHRLLKESISNPNWPNFKMLTINLIKYSINPLFWGVIPLLFILLCLFRWRHLIKKYLLECSFLLMGFMGLSVLLYYLSAGFPRYSMTIVPIMFIVVLKEVDALMLEKRKI